MSRKKAPRYRFEKYLQVPANLRQLILENNLSQAEIVTFLLACEETVGKGCRAARLSNTDIAAKNSMGERTAVRARTSLKEHGMLTVDISENCWKTHESGLVSPNFPMIQAGEDVPEEGDPVTGATVTDGSSPTVMDDRGATVTDGRENHHHQIQDKNQEEKRQADSPTEPRKTSEPRKADDDDEKTAKTPAAPKTPKNTFLLRVAQRHPEVDAPACFADVQGDLRKGRIPFDAFLRRDLLTTTNPKAITNPRGYYRALAKMMVAEHQKQMAGIPTEGVVETPRCAKCNGSGYLLERIEGLRPLQTGEFCDCKLGEELAALERRAAKKAAAAVERKQPGQAPGQTALPAAGGLQ